MSKGRDVDRVTSPLVSSLLLQLRVIGALLMREIITRYGRDNLGFLWLFLEPILFTVGVTALWTTAGLNHASNLPIVAFAVTGYSSVLLWRNMPNRCAAAIPPNTGLLYHRNVRIIDLFITRVALEMAGATLSFAALATLFSLLGWMDFPADIATVIGGWLLIAWFGGALAIIIGTLTVYSETVERLWHPASYLLFPLSGAAFMVDWLPRQFQEILLYLPMLNGIELLRDGYFGSTFRTHYDIGYTVTVCLVMTLLGFALMRRASRRVEVE